MGAVQRQIMERETLAAQRDAAILDRNAAEAERDELIEGRDSLTRDRDFAVAEMTRLHGLESRLCELEGEWAQERARVFDLTNKLHREMTRAFTAENRVVELQIAERRLASIESSRVWRLVRLLTAPGRWLVRRLER